MVNFPKWLWGGQDRPDGVKKGDIIAMSTMAMVPVVRNAHGDVEPGDDASGAGWVPLSAITDANVFGIKGHAAMLLQAARLAGVSDQIPKSFDDTLKARTSDITVATEYLQQKASILFNVSTTGSAAPGLEARLG